MKISIKIKAVLIFTLIAIPQAGYSTRIMRVPSVYWHAFKNLTSTACNSYANATRNNIEITITNPSTYTQTVTLTATPVVSIMKGSDGTHNLSMGWGTDGSSLSNPQSITFTLSSGQSLTGISFQFAYWGSSPGLYDLDGGVDLLFQVAEDKGFLTAGYSTVLETPCDPGNTNPNSITYVYKSFRNVPKVFYVNGGRPF